MLFDDGFKTIGLDSPVMVYDDGTWCVLDTISRGWTVTRAPEFDAGLGATAWRAIRRRVVVLSMV
jgi:hypothetical protein